METQTEEKRAEKKGRSNVKWLAIIAAMLAVIIGLVVVLLTRPAASEPEPARTYETEVSARLGQLENKSEADIQAELDRVVEEGMFHVAINGRPIFEDGESEGNLEIENVPSNHYLMRVEINLVDTGELVYSTKYIEPNMHIQRAKLDVPLEAGWYDATATFYAYDPDTLVEMGSVASRLTIIVKN